MSTIDDIRGLPARMDELEHRIDMLYKVVRTVYLPMDCPNCGRHRLEYDGMHVVCEKCGSTDWEHPSRRHETIDGLDISSLG